MKNPLLDQEFLRKLDLMKNKITYAKIILLTWNEEPIEEIQGKITSGSINIDGASAIRRTCSLSMVSEKVNINNTYWALKNKFKLEVGVENTIDSQYPDIIWFKQGVFVFTSLNMNVQSNNFTISLNGKDKMCLLNGEVGGSINASTDFGKLEEYSTLENGEIIRNVIDIPIVDIIKNAVHVYGGEPLHNIVLNDIDNYGLELLEYRGDNNLYMPRHIQTGEVSNLIINKRQKYYLSNGDKVYVDNDENYKEDNRQIIYYDRTGLNTNIATKVWADRSSIGDKNQAYNIIKIEFGETSGYRHTELTYPGELVANVGESLVTILDKIKNMFSDFEYFYDIDGRFIFQKKKTYINTSFNNLATSNNTTYAQDAAYISSTVYSFENGMLLSAFSNAPQILNIKNDYSIWGKRKGVTGADIPIHMRYAIDLKPKYYKPIRFDYKKIKLSEDEYKPNVYYTYSSVLKKHILSTSSIYDSTKQYYEETDKQILTVDAFTSTEYDWREIIYQMALDYFKYNHKKHNFTQLVAAANPEYYPTGITGYEAYYTDMQGFWRELYHPGAMSENGEDQYYQLFTHDELYEAAKEVILQERAFIEEQDIAQLMINYIYNKFNTVRNNFIEYYDYAGEEVDTERDISLLISRCVGYGFTESSKVIRGLLADRWIKMGGQDPYDYEDIIEEYIEDYAKNNDISFKEAEQELQKDAWYKTCIIMGNYKAEKEFLDEYSEVDLALEITNQLRKGKSEYSSVIQNLLATRWKKMMLIYNEDPFDYLNLMEQEYVENGETSLYRAYILMYEYSNKQKEDYVDESIVIMREVEKGKIEIVDPYLSFLYTAREKKLGKTSGPYIISNEKLLWVISTVIKTFEISKRMFKNQVEEMLQQQMNKTAYDFSQEIIDYIENHYELRKDFFYINNKTNKISIENAHIQYLLDMRQEKIDEIGDTLFYINNDIFVITLLEIFENESDPEKFKIEIQKKINSVYSLMNKMDYDFAFEVMDYICLHYDKKDSFFNVIEEQNIIEVKDQYLQFLLIMRQDKINEFYGEDFYPQNDVFITLVDEIIKSEENKDNFKNALSKLLDKFKAQTVDENYDFSAEVIDYIYINYNNEQKEFFSIDGELIIVLDQYLKHLFKLRQNKLNRLGNSVIYTSNYNFMKYITDTISEAENADDFKNKIMEKLNKTES